MVEGRDDKGVRGKSSFSFGAFQIGLGFGEAPDVGIFVLAFLGVGDARFLQCPLAPSVGFLFFWGGV